MPIHYKGETLSHIGMVIEHDQVYYTSGEHVSGAPKNSPSILGSLTEGFGVITRPKIRNERAMGDKEVSLAVRDVLANMFYDQSELEKAKKVYTRIRVGLEKQLLKKRRANELLATNFRFIDWTRNDGMREDRLAYKKDYNQDFDPFKYCLLSPISQALPLHILRLLSGFNPCIKSSTLFENLSHGYLPRHSRTKQARNHIQSLGNLKFDKANGHLKLV